MWGYYFRHAFSSIVENRLIHAISIGTITISLLLLGAFVLLFVNVSAWVENWEQSLSMSVYLREGVDEKAREKILAAIRDIPGMEIKGFISKERALLDLKKMLGAQAALVENLSRNPLPASFEVHFKEGMGGTLDPKKIKTDLEKVNGVDEVQYSEQWLERFQGILYVMKVVGFVIGGLLSIAVLFIITNTVKLAIYSRQEEVEILKLVGASDWFVKAPFLIEGAMQGALASCLSLLILFLLYSLFSLKKIQVFDLPLLDAVFLSDVYCISLLVLGFTLGLLGSFIAVGRFFER